MDTSACRCRSKMSDQPVRDHEVRRCRLRRAVEGGLFMSMRNLGFAASDDRVFSRVCSGVPSGMRRSCRILVGHVDSFWVGWHREWEEKAPRPMEFELCSLACRAFNQPRIYVLCCVLYVLGVMRIQSLCNGEVGRGHYLIL
jgi:hypothetical protein